MRNEGMAILMQDCNLHTVLRLPRGTLTSAKSRNAATSST